MTDFFKMMGFRTADQIIAWLESKHIRKYEVYPNRVDIDPGYYHSTEYEEDTGGHGYTSSIYVWTDRNKRMSFHFISGELKNILAPTSSMVYI
jgi:hypothetical protein